MEFGDWSRLDRTLATTLEQWRRRTAELGSLASLPDVERDLEARELARSPVPELLIHEETRHALAERADDPLARALRPWIETFWLEDAVYGARHALAVAWGAPRAVRGRATETSARTLRRELIDGHHASVRERAADDLLTLAESVHERAVQLLERRIEREASVPRDCRMLVVPDFSGSADDPATEVVAVAERVLVLTDELSAELRDGPWFEGPRRGLAAGARDGWPVRPTLRWLREVFGCDELTRGLPIRAFKLPAALGAASYARALG
ncbi:MAG: hypothetical protein FJ096_22880, partial [Deltaproteobacteria bacterium]|nr:hypothetical protein [Deltaproteobacteria bacterium]